MKKCWRRESRGSTTQPSTTATGNPTRKRKGERTPVVKSEEKAETLNEQAVNTAGEHGKKDGSRAADEHVRKDRATDDSPDWGGSSDDNRQEAHDQQWPWGTAGRPSDGGGSTGVLAERPNEPVGKPPLRQGPSAEYGGGVRAQLTPSPMWLDVRRVQAHMAKARKKRAPSS